MTFNIGECISPANTTTQAPRCKASEQKFPKKRAVGFTPLVDGPRLTELPAGSNQPTVFVSERMSPSVTVHLSDASEQQVGEGSTACRSV